MRRLLVFAFIAGCSRTPAPEAVPVVEAGPVKVTLAKPKVQAIRWTIEQPGTIEPFEQTAIVAKFPGYIRALHADTGTRVNGPSWWGMPQVATLLAEMDMPEVEREVNQKEAMTAMARAEVAVARKNRSVAVAAVESAKANIREMEAGEARVKADFDHWTLESTRIDRLVSQGTIDKQTAEETRRQLASTKGASDEAIARSASAKTALREAEAKQERSDLEILTAEARVNAAVADLRRVERLLEYREIRAPFAGVVSRKFISPGAFMQPASGGRSETLFTVSRTDLMRLIVEVPEYAADRIKNGSSVRVNVPALVDAPDWVGKVARKSDTLHPQTRTLRVEIDLPNPEGRILSYMYARAIIPIESPQAMCVPASAVAVLDEQSFAYLAAEGKAVKFFVLIGHSEGGQTELLGIRKTPRDAYRPLTGQEAFIVSHEGPLSDGAKIAVK